MGSAYVPVIPELRRIETWRTGCGTVDRMTPLDPLGPFFAVEVLDEAPDESTGWTRVGDTFGDPGMVDTWVRRAWTRITGEATPSASDRRTLGAVLHLGVTARLVSPWIGRFLLAGDPRVPAFGDLWWRDDGTTMFPLAFVVSHRAASSSAGATDDLADAFARDLVDRVAVPVKDSGLTASAAILRGNAASAVNTAVGLVLRQGAPTAERHLLGRRIVTRCVDLLDAQAPAATGDALTAQFRRTSCCLAYALPSGSRNAVCGDCVLRA